MVSIKILVWGWVGVSVCVWGGGGRLKPVLRDLNLTLSFCYGSKYAVSCSVRVKVFYLINGSSRETNTSRINNMMKQRWRLDRNNVLRPTPGDPCGVEQPNWNTGIKENQQLNALRERSALVLVHLGKKGECKKCFHIPFVCKQDSHNHDTWYLLVASSTFP